MVASGSSTLQAAGGSDRFKESTPSAPPVQTADLSGVAPAPASAAEARHELAALQEVLLETEWTNKPVKFRKQFPEQK